MNFIGLDIETTGLDNKTDQIIEIALIKISKEGVTESYQTLINPNIAIPSNVSYITGIQDSDIKDAPSLDEVKNKIIDFIGDNPIFGHCIGFDVNFLIEKGLHLEKNILLDTLELAPIAFPTEKSMSLETLSNKLNLDHRNKHRANDDILATSDLYKKIKETLSEKLDPKTLSQINEYLKKSDWQWKFLFHEIQNVEAIRESPQNNVQTPFMASQRNAQIAYPNEDLDNLINSNQKIIVECENYEKNDLINSCLKNNEKTAIVFDKISNKYNHNDITYLYNPEFYFCGKKFAQFLKKEKFTNEESSFLIKMLILQKASKDGLKFETHLIKNEQKLWIEVSADQEDCVNCNLQECFYQKTIQRIKNKKIICTTHRNLLNSFSKDQENLLANRKIIIDNIEKLEKNCQNNLTKIFDLNSFDYLLNLEPPNNEILQIKTKIEMIFGLFGIIMNKYSQSFYASEIVISNDLANTLEWKNIQGSIDQLEQLTDARPSKNLTKKIKDLKETVFSFGNNIVKIYLTKEGDLKIINTQTECAKFIKTNLWDKIPNFLLISKNIQTSNGFDFIKNELNLDENISCFSLPYSAEKSINFELHKSSSSYEEINFLNEYLEQDTGITFLLTSSLSSVKSFWQNFSPEFKKRDKLILAQNISGGINKTIEAFLIKKESLLIGNYDFFFTICEELKEKFPNIEDRPQIKTLIVHKMLFDHPENPIAKQKLKNFANRFKEYSLPKAILNLKIACSYFFELKGEKIIGLDYKLGNQDYRILENMPSYVKEDDNNNQSQQYSLF